jgi:hypothetical protein
MISHTTKSPGGTSFHGTTIITNVGKLKSLFPGSYYSQNDGEDKTNYDFTLEVNGVVFTIYDWKEYRPIGDDEQITFHIGGSSKEITETAKSELLKLL